MAQRKPVVLQHGLLDNSGTWLVPTVEKQLPPQLIAEGYDVWMLNNRGNINSYEHIDPKKYSVFRGDSPYWDFSFDEMAEFDVAANLDYVLAQTGAKKVTWIGHS